MRVSVEISAKFMTNMASPSEKTIGGSIYLPLWSAWKETRYKILGGHLGNVGPCRTEAMVQTEFLWLCYSIARTEASSHIYRSVAISLGRFILHVEYGTHRLN